MSRGKRAMVDTNEADDDWEEMQQWDNEQPVPDLEGTHNVDQLHAMGWADEAGFLARPGMRPEDEAIVEAFAPSKDRKGMHDNLTVTGNMICQFEGCEFSSENEVGIQAHYKTDHPGHIPEVTRTRRCRQCAAVLRPCDGTHPCARCVQKGETCEYLNVKGRVCNECHKIKRQCDRQQPCSWCIRRETDCTYEYEEVQGACTECHRLRRKCDSKKPCASCTSRGAVCSYAKPTGSGSATAKDRSCMECNTRKRKCDREEPCEACTQYGRVCTYAERG
jgi:hypothetical protein